MRDEQAERLIEVMARLHLEIHTLSAYLRENADKWIVWLTSRGGR